MTRPSALASTVLLLLATMLASSAFAAPSPYTLVEYRHLGPFTSRDPQRLRKLDLMATDLGVAFPFQNGSGERQLMFLFGDSHPFGPPLTGHFDEDTIAAAPIDWTDRRLLPRLDWLTRSDGLFLSLLVPGEDLRAMEVPLDAVQVGERVLIFFNGGWQKDRGRHTYLICAEARNGQFDQLTPRFKQPSDKFLNVSLSPDPDDPQTIWIFGTGHYRRSPVYVAKAPAATLDDFATWQFRSGDAWVKSEAEATPLIGGRMGELSARFVPAAESWVLTYQRRRQRGQIGLGVYARFAPAPTGPWSDELPLLQPSSADRVGFTQFMHAPVSVVGFDDGLSTPGREADWGDPYGPYLVPEWCYVEDGKLHLIHTLSSWNPYQVQLMDAVVSKEPPPATQPADAEPAWEAPLAAPWAAAGAAFTEHAEDGERWLRLKNGNGRLESNWTVGKQERWLAFKLRGNAIVARLFDETGHCVRETRRPAGTESDVTHIAWRVDGIRGQRVRLTIDAEARADSVPGLSQPTLKSHR